MVKLLKHGDHCPCCGRPLKEGLPDEVMVFLSRLAEFKAAIEETQHWEDENLSE